MESGKIIEDLINNRKIQIWIIAIIIIGILPYALNTMQFGMDFTGGTIIGVKLEEEADQIELDETIEILQGRLNSFGLKDIKVRPSGNELITVEIAETDPKVVNQLQTIIAEQGKFEALFEGNAVLKGDQILEVITSPQEGFGWRSTGSGYEWSVPFLISNEAANQFAESIEGKCTVTAEGQRCEEFLYMFIDRPSESIIILDKSTHEEEKLVPIDFEISETFISLEELMKNSGIEYIVTNEIDEDVVEKIEGKNIIIKPGTFDKDELTSAEKIKEIEQDGDYWIDEAINIENIVYLTPGVTSGKPITRPTITGFSLSEEEAAVDVKRIEILLRSGKLPVEVSIDTSSTISPLLGKDFLNYSLLAGLCAILAVVGIIWIRYREIKVAVPLLITALSEVVMILGMAVWIGWQLDLAAVAGIIAAVGTGVDHQIIITDEVIRKEQEQMSFLGRVKKAFGIITMAASTTILAMLPLWFIGTGTLRGFALTTIIGSLIGVLISRPAFAEIIKRILEE